jgi:hypothetical protein
MINFVNEFHSVRNNGITLFDDLLRTVLFFFLFHGLRSQAHSPLAIIISPLQGDLKTLLSKISAY